MTTTDTQEQGNIVPMATAPNPIDPGVTIGHVHLRTADIDYTIDLADAAHFTPAQWQTHRHWNVTIPEAPSARHQAYRDLCSLLVTLDHSGRQAALQHLNDWAAPNSVARATSPCAINTTDIAPRPTHRMLTEPELLSLLHDPLIDLGAHTVTHPLLSALPPDAQHAEISTSKSTLECLLGRPIHTFAYPFGCRRDYTSDSVSAVKYSGFACACSNFIGKVTPDTDPHQLPRLLIRNWPADEFRARLTQWLAMTPKNPNRSHVHSAA